MPINPRLRRDQSQRKGYRCLQLPRFLIAFVVLSSAWSAIGRSFDPYKTLGVSRTASPDELKKRYRKLCLKYHPDKNVSKSAKERELAEKRFKQVQAAYDMIENGSSPRYHPDADNSWSPPRHQQYADNNRSSGRSGSTPTADDIFRRRFGNFDNVNFFTFEPGKPGRNYFGPRGSRRFGTGSPFSAYYDTGTRFQSPFFASDSTLKPSDFKSLYVQSVKVPLEVLYKGDPSYRFKLRESIYTRYQASIRGKMIFFSLYQGIFAMLPILRMRNRLLAYVAAIFVIHSTTPKPTRTYYSKPLLKGAKGGETSVSFVDNQIEIEFQIEEGEHPVYRRRGNDLYTDLSITSAEAKNGCTKRLRALDTTEDDIEITIPRGKYRYEKQMKNRRHLETHSSHKTIKIRNRGWPIRVSNENNRNHSDEYRYGHLFVVITVQKPSSKQR